MVLLTHSEVEFVLNCVVVSYIRLCLLVLSFSLPTVAPQFLPKFITPLYIPPSTHHLLYTLMVKSRLMCTARNFLKIYTQRKQEVLPYTLPENYIAMPPHCQKYISLCFQ